MSDFLTNVVAFVVLISILVAVHEYGHYIVGRWTGMKVLRFSIGFGKPLLTHIGKKDGTEFCVSAIPLGGYVRFLDSREASVEPEDEGRAFDQRPIPARIAVLLAGPAFNFLFAIIAYWVVLAGGVFVTQPVVGTVQSDSYAEQAGLIFGDKIIAVGDSDTREWEETLVAILGEMTRDGKVPMTLESANGEQRKTVIDVGVDKTRLTEPGLLFDGLGFHPWPPAVVGELPEEGAAAIAGLAIGDRITSIDGELVNTFGGMRAVVEPRAGKDVLIEYVRDGREDSLRLIIGQHDLDGGETQGILGVRSIKPGEGYFYRRAYSPIESFQAAAVKTWSSTVFTVQMLSRMVTGDVSIKNISGPISIAQIAGASAERGWQDFVGILAVISISLGVLNLLPIPMLDGGQIVYQLIEALKGGPMTERAQVLGQQVGILALLLLMSFAFYNDIASQFG